jgi:hypothetical protein
MKKIKSFQVFESENTGVAKEAKELNDIVEPALLALIEDYDPSMDSWLKDERIFILQFMFPKRNKKKTELSINDVSDYIEDSNYLAGVYKHLYTAMKKIISSGYECTLSHDNGDGNADGSPGPYYIRLIVPRKGITDKSELDWVDTKNNRVTISKKKLNTWLGEFSQSLEMMDYEEEGNNVIQLTMDIGGLGLGGETPTARQILKMEKELKSNNRIIDINIQDTKVILEFQLEEGETFAIRP